MPTSTASAKTAIQLPSGKVMDVNDFTAHVLTKGTDEVFSRGFDLARFPFEGSMFYDPMDLMSATYTTQTSVGIGNVPRNDDGETIPADVQAEGFAHTLTSYEYRKRVHWTRKLIEDMLYDTQLTDRSMELMYSARRTVELIMADGVNRAIGDNSSGAPFLCEDGMYWIDSARPNPVAVAGTWSNLEATGALSVSMIFDATLNLNQRNDARGNRAMYTLDTIFIRPNEQKTMDELRMSPKDPTNAMNTVNWLYNQAIGYRTYNLMTTQQIMYKASGKNEVKQLWRKRPDVLPVTTPEDPDVFGARVRFRFGLGALRPDVWSAGLLS